MSFGNLAPRGPPVIPDKFRIYDSYVEDPKWQIKFTLIWTSILAFTTLLSIPYIVKTIRTGRYYSSLAISESLETRPPKAKSTSPSTSKKGSQRKVQNGTLSTLPTRAFAIWQSISLWTLPMPKIVFWRNQIGDCCRRAYFTLGVAQIFLVLGYVGASIACFVAGAQLLQNSNRPGFVALSQLPLVLLLSLKSPLPFPIFLPTLSYEHYNYLHRWAGRNLFLLVSVHGGMWLNQFITTNQWDQVWSDKSKRGMIAYGLMCGIVITSLKPIRRMFYQLFWAAHLVLFVGFFAAISYHTPYSRPWVYPCVAIYAYDFLVRMLRYRIKDATLVPVDETMTMIHIPDCDSGWLPTQHVFVRILRGSGIFESHPFTITNAPPSGSSSSPRGIMLYAKNSGDWTRRLHSLSKAISTLEVGEDVAEREGFLAKEKEGVVVGADHPGKKVAVVIDGPYGGLKLDMGEYERVLMVGGGSGITFVLGAIEECLRVKQGGPGPDIIDVAWVVRDMSTIQALSPTLSRLESLASRLKIELRYNLYLSKPPSPLPSVPTGLPVSTTLNPYHPEISQLVTESLPLDSGSNTESGATFGGGLAVIACGPEGIVSEARNAIATLSVKSRVQCGGVGFYGECYAL